MRLMTALASVLLVSYTACAFAADTDPLAAHRVAYLHAVSGPALSGLPTQVHIIDSEALGQRTIALYTVNNPGHRGRAIWLLTTDAQCEQPQLVGTEIVDMGAHGQSHACTLIGVHSVDQHVLASHLRSERTFSWFGLAGDEVSTNTTVAVMASPGSAR